jgi:threonine synthase
VQHLVIQAQLQLMHARGYDRIKSFIMLPNGNMSEVQRRQMSTIKAANVFALKDQMEPLMIAKTW